MKLLSHSSLLVGVVVVVQVLLVPVALAHCDSPMDPCVTVLDCGGCSADHGGNIPDPEDCHGYYVCVNDTDYLPLPAQCPDGETFDYNTLQCNATAECFTCQECVFDCADSSTPSFISSFNDCNEYYQCTDGGEGDVINCPAENPFFNGQFCQTQETQCCRCQPSCTGGQFAVIDPLDCRKYWLCPNTDPPSNFGVCDEGVFDATLEACSLTATCATACPNVLNTDGCIEPFTCLSTGFFAKCTNQCIQEYYNCTEETWPEYRESELCLEGTVFHPDDHICVDPSDCPY